MVRVRLRAVGQFEQLLGRRETSADVPDGSTVLDLLRRMDAGPDSEAEGLPAAAAGGGDSGSVVSCGLLALLYDSSGRQTSAARIFLNGRDVARGVGPSAWTGAAAVSAAARHGAAGAQTMSYASGCTSCIRTLSKAGERGKGTVAS
jgi:hypothetical protein